MTTTSLDRLKSQLLTSGVQQENIALFQVINQLIDYLRTNINTTQDIVSGGSGSGIGSGVGLVNASYLTKIKEVGLPNSLQEISGSGIEFNDSKGRRIISSAIPFGLEVNEEQIENISLIPGPVGPRGINSICIPGIDGLDGEPGESLIPGPPGISIQGIQGIPGQNGLDIPGIDGLDGENEININGRNSYNFTSGSIIFAGRGGLFSQDNANLFWDNVNKRLGLGTITPNHPFTLYSSNINGIEVISTAALGITSGGGVRLNTDTTPTDVNQRLGAIIFGSYNGVDSIVGTSIESFSSEVWTFGDNTGSYLVFKTTHNGAFARAERMRITDLGHVLIGTTVDGSSQLAIVGLPVAAAGLSAGDIWVDTTGGLNILKIV